MWKITMQVDGMQCGMCEAHVNEAVRNAFRVKKVTSSHSAGQTVLLTEQEMTEESLDKLKEVVEETGYRVLSLQVESYEKKGFSLFRR